QLHGIKALDVYRIVAGALVQGVHARRLDRVGGDEQLAADVNGDVVRGGELHRGPGAAPAQLRLEAARRVVDPGVDHAAVVSGLVGAQPVSLLEQDEGRVGSRLEQPQRCGQADDAAADDAVVEDHRLSPMPYLDHAATSPMRPEAIAAVNAAMAKVG